VKIENMTGTLWNRMGTS